MTLDADVYLQCSACDLIAFEPKPCTVCSEANSTKHLRFCTGCRMTCAKCGEACCEDHRWVRALPVGSEIRCHQCWIGDDQAP